MLSLFVIPIWYRKEKLDKLFLYFIQSPFSITFNFQSQFQVKWSLYFFNCEKMNHECRFNITLSHKIIYKETSWHPRPNLPYSKKHIVRIKTSGRSSSHSQWSIKWLASFQPLCNTSSILKCASRLSSASRAPTIDLANLGPFVLPPYSHTEQLLFINRDVHEVGLS